MQASIHLDTTLCGWCVTFGGRAVGFYLSLDEAKAGLEAAMEDREGKDKDGVGGLAT